LAGLNKRLATVQMPPVLADFAAAIKGKRNLASMRDAVATLLAQKKIEANEIADKIDANLKTLDAEVRKTNVDYSHLFRDYAALVLKAPDDLALVIASRIDAENKRHAAETARILEAEREKIRIEEEARAAVKVKEETIAEERAKKEADAKLLAEAWVSKPEPAPLPATVAPTAAAMGGYTAASPVTDAARTVITVDGPFTSDIQIHRLDTGATMKLGEISTALGFTVTAKFLLSLGFAPARQEKNAKLYRASDFPALCNNIANHVNAVACAHTMRAAA
jgi:hypothetical protein